MFDSSEDIFSGLFGGIFYGLGISDLAVPCGFLLWLSIFMVSLNNIDFSHTMTACVYVLFCSFSGVILVLALPAEYLKFRGIGVDLFFIMVFSLISYYQWVKKDKLSRVQRKRE